MCGDDSLSHAVGENTARTVKQLAGLTIIVCHEHEPFLDDTPVDKAKMEGDFLYIRESLWKYVEPTIRRLGHVKVPL